MRTYLPAEFSTSTLLLFFFVKFPSPFKSSAYQKLRLVPFQKIWMAFWSRVLFFAAPENVGLQYYCARVHNHPHHHLLNSSFSFSFFSSTFLGTHDQHSSFDTGQQQPLRTNLSPSSPPLHPSRWQLSPPPFLLFPQLYSNPHCPTSISLSKKKCYQLFEVKGLAAGVAAIGHLISLHMTLSSSPSLPLSITSSFYCNIFQDINFRQPIIPHLKQKNRCSDINSIHTVEWRIISIAPSCHLSSFFHSLSHWINLTLLIWIKIRIQLKRCSQDSEFALMSHP